MTVDRRTTSPARVTAPGALLVVVGPAAQAGDARQDPGAVHSPERLALPIATDCGVDVEARALGWKVVPVDVDRAVRRFRVLSRVGLEEGYRLARVRFERRGYIPSCYLSWEVRIQAPDGELVPYDLSSVQAVARIDFDDLPTLVELWLGPPRPWDMVSDEFERAKQLPDCRKTDRGRCLVEAVWRLPWTVDGAIARRWLRGPVYSRYALEYDAPLSTFVLHRFPVDEGRIVDDRKVPFVVDARAME